jgi:hypothetical protein
VNDIIIRSPDTDVFVLALHFAQNIEQQVQFDTVLGIGDALLTCTWSLLKQERTSVLHSQHSGWDSTSAFVRKGQKTVLKIIKQHPEYLEAFLSLGRSIRIDELTSQRLEGCCCLLYGGSAPYGINQCSMTWQILRIQEHSYIHAVELIWVTFLHVRMLWTCTWWDELSSPGLVHVYNIVMTLLPP